MWPEWVTAMTSVRPPGCLSAVAGNRAVIIVPATAKHKRIHSSRGLFFYLLQRFKNCLFRILERGEDVLGNLLNEFRSPERVGHIVVDDADVMKIKRHVWLV